MAVFINRLRRVGIGKETTRGTAVAPSDWVPHTELTIEDRDAKIMDNSALGTIHSAFFGDTESQWSEGDLNGVIYDQTFGLLLLATFGSVTSTLKGTETAVYNHSYSVLNTNEHPSLTLALKDLNEDVRAAMAMIGSLEITAEQGSYVTYSSSFQARKSLAATNTAVDTAQNRFRPQDFTVRIADTVAGLDAAAPVSVRNLTLTFNKNIIREPSLGTVQPNFYNGVFETSLSFGRLYNDTTFKDYVFSGGKKALRISFTRPDITIGTGSNPSLVFTFEPGFFSEWGREGGLDDLMSETTTYTPLFSTSAARQLQVVLTNTRASY